MHLIAVRQFTGGHAGDECPAREGDYESLADACANEYEVLQADQSTGAHVDGVRRASAGARVPRPHAYEDVRDARSNASTLQKSLAPAQARRGATVFREGEQVRA